MMKCEHCGAVSPGDRLADICRECGWISHPMKEKPKPVKVEKKEADEWQPQD